MTRVDRDGAEAHVTQTLRERAEKLTDGVEALARELAAPIPLGHLDAQESGSRGPALEFLASTVRSLSTSEDQISLLDRLLEGAAGCFSRTCLFLVRGDMALGWSSVGLPEIAGEDPARALKIPLDQGSLLSAARDGGLPARSEGGDNAAELLPPVEPGQRIPRRTIVIPIRVRNRVSALLYGDDGGDAAETFDDQSAEILALVTSLSADRLSLHAGIAEEEAAASTDVQIALPVRTEEVDDAAPSPPDLFEPDPLDEELEVGSLSQEQGRGAAPASPEEARLHEDARRFARLLVSELLLYNEDTVVAGRRQRDLYQRLQQEIEKSREAYERRVPNAVRLRTDYFKEELIRTLALGDPLAMGMR